VFTAIVAGTCTRNEARFAFVAGLARPAFTTIGLVVGNSSAIVAEITIAWRYLALRVALICGVCNLIPISIWTRLTNIVNHMLVDSAQNYFAMRVAFNHVVPSSVHLSSRASCTNMAQHAFIGTARPI
jgi:hypothetical protein